MQIPSGSSLTLSGDGSWRLLFKRCVSAWASRPNGTALRRPSEGPPRRCWVCSPSGLVREEPSDLLRRFGVGAKGAVGPGGTDFLRVVCTDGHGKSPTSLHGTADRGGLLRSLMAKVQLRTPLFACTPRQLGA